MTISTGEEYRLSMIRESAEFLGNYRIPTAFLYQLINESLIAKKDISDKLGLYQENNYRYTIVLPQDINEMPEIHNFLKAFLCLKRETDNEIWTIIDPLYVMDAKKNKFKITRLLSKHWEQLVYYGETRCLLLKAKLIDRDWRAANFNSDDKCRFNAKFPVWYGDQIANGRILVISSNPLDILRASSNASFQSCYRPEGEQFNGTIANMLAPNVIMITVETSDNVGYKIGRSWLYVSEQIILPARLYGGIYETHHLHARNYIEKCLGGHWKLLIGETLGSKWITTLGPSYPDNGTGSVVVNTEEYPGKYKKLIIPLAMCLSCGIRHNDCAVRGMCRKCWKTWEVNKKPVEDII